MLGSDAVIAHTQKWLSRVVIGHGLCPFAKAEFDAGRIDYAVITAQGLESLIEPVLTACDALNTDKTIATSLLIYPVAFLDFGDYLDALDLAERLLTDQGYDGIYQLASFHPRYVFDGAAAEDASHYTNRSPYPMFHILREASVAAALEAYPNPEAIPARNIELTRRLGVNVMRDLLLACSQNEGHT